MCFHYVANALVVTMIKGEDDAVRLCKVPQASKLLTLALYPTSALDSFGEIHKTVTLTVRQGKNVLSTATRNVRLPTGTIPDINLAAYAIYTESLTYDKAPMKVIKDAKEAGGYSPDDYETYELNIDLAVTETNPA